MRLWRNRQSVTLSACSLLWVLIVLQCLVGATESRAGELPGAAPSSQKQLFHDCPGTDQSGPLPGGGLNQSSRSSGEPHRAPAKGAPRRQDPQAEPFQLHVERHQLKGGAGESRFDLNGEAGRLLARFQLELVVDHSLSMSDRDCPGHQSRWRWCGAQAEDLARAIAPYSKNGITVTSFAWRFQVVEHASAEVIEQLFHRHALTPGTRLAAPLKDRLDHFFAHRSEDHRPLLLAVITDGLPYPPPESLIVRHVLGKEARKIRTAGEATVVFLQIGKLDLLGRAYLRGLEKSFRHRDRQHPFVRRVSFKQLKRSGLAGALVQVVEKTFSADGHPQ